MARILADEDIYTDLKQRLRAYGHDVLSVTELDSRGDGDHLWMLRASEDERVILTHNWRDFLLLHNAWNAWLSHWKISPTPRHPGILSVPQRDVLGADQAASSVHAFLHEERPLANMYYWLFPARGWVGFDWFLIRLTQEWGRTETEAFGIPTNAAPTRQRVKCADALHVANNAPSSLRRCSLIVGPPA